MSMKAVTVITLLFALLFSVAISSSSGRGWPEKVDWKTYSEGLEEMKNTGKPMMIIFHKEWW